MERVLWLAVDVTGATALAVAGVLAFGVGRRRRAPGALFWFGAAAGLLYLGLDERFSLHERIGRRLYEAGVPTPPGVNHMDDIVLLALAVAGLTFSLVFAGEVVASRRFAWGLLLAAGITGLALTVDAVAPVEGWAPRVEETFELCGQITFLVVFSMRWVEVTGRSPAVLTPLWRVSASDGGAGDVARVAEDVLDGHALDHQAERAGDAAR